MEYSNNTKHIDINFSVEVEHGDGKPVKKRKSHTFAWFITWITCIAVYCWLFNQEGLHGLDNPVIVFLERVVGCLFFISTIVLCWKLGGFFSKGGVFGIRI